MEENDGVYTPISLEKDYPLYFATDNCDSQNDRLREFSNQNLQIKTINNQQFL